MSSHGGLRLSGVAGLDRIEDATVLDQRLTEHLIGRSSGEALTRACAAEEDLRDVLGEPVA